MSGGFPLFNRLAETRDGLMIYNGNDVYIGRSIEAYGEFSQGELTLFDQVLRPGMTVVEIGANIGTHTVAIAKAVGPQGLVHAFEPQRLVFQALCGNIALNSLTNVIAHHAAAGEDTGELLVPVLDTTREQNFGGLGLGGFETGEPVEVMALDRLELDRCHLIKVDAEGMEESALRGAVQSISQHRPVLYFEGDRQDKAASLLRFVDSLDYDLYWHRPPLFNPDNYRGDAENLFPGLVSTNVLVVHRATNSTVTLMERVEIPPAGG